MTATFPGQLVDINSRPVALPRTTRRRLAKQFSNLTTNNYFPSIPWSDITTILSGSGITPVQEDGSKWAGFFTGREGQASIQLALDQTNIHAVLAGGETKEGHVLLKAALQLTWYKMPSGRYEIVAYVF